MDDSYYYGMQDLNSYEGLGFNYIPNEYIKIGNFQVIL